jgi:outer membrane protein OmpA-like peptidoglycan-associated protein
MLSIPALTPEKKPEAPKAVTPAPEVKKPAEAAKLPEIPEFDSPKIAPLPPLPDSSALAPKKVLENLPPPELPKPAETAKPPAPITAIPTPATAAKKAQAEAPPPPVVAPLLKSAGSGDTMGTIGFAKDMTELNDQAKSELNALAERIKQSQSSVRVVGYAAGSADQASVARRISLSRALAVRAFLIDKGVNPLSIKAEAKGNQIAEGAPDRADIFVN